MRLTVSRRWRRVVVANWAGFSARLFLCLIAVAGAAAAQPRAGAGAVAITVNAREEGPTISRDIFGQFAEHIGTGVYGGVWVGPDSSIANVRGIRTDVVEALRALSVPNVRWPGGCYAESYHWRNGVGPRAERPATLNAEWGAVIESNHFGVHEYFDFLDQIGARAFISVNLATGAPREAAEWLEYMTAAEPTALAQERAANGHERPFAAPLLGLGNESWSCGGPMSVEHYIEEMKRYARFARNLDPAQTGETAMRRIAVGPGFPRTEWTEAVMQAWKDHDWSWNIEGLSIHNYTIGGWPPSYRSDRFGEGEYAALVSETLGMDQFIAGQVQVMDRFDPDKEIGLYVDEWGVWLAPLEGENPAFLPQQNSLRDAIIAALNLNIFARHADRVRGANIAQMVNVLQAMILTDGPLMVLTPTYHVFHMYVPFQDAVFTPVSFDGGVYEHGDVSIPRVDAVAARGRDGALWLAVTNVDPDRAASLVINVRGASVRSAMGQVLTAPRVDSHNTFDAPNAVRPRPISARASGGSLRLEAPSKSVLVVRLAS